MHKNSQKSHSESNRGSQQKLSLKMNLKFTIEIAMKHNTQKERKLQKGAFEPKNHKTHYFVPKCTKTRKNRTWKRVRAAALCACMITLNFYTENQYQKTIK